MAEKILYYFGAGASVNLLPLARSIRDGIREIPGLAFALHNFDFTKLESKVPGGIKDLNIKKMKSRFHSLTASANEFGDVDTYAKFLYLTESNDSKLIELKRTLTEFFTLTQMLAAKQEPRYLPWLVSVMNKKIFPDNIKILSWNYDFQVQMAYDSFSENEEVDFDGTGFSYSPSTLSYYPNLDPTFSEYHKLSLIHLNGLAGYFRQKDHGLFSLFQKKFTGKLPLIIESLEKYGIDNLIHFAWEKSEYHSHLTNHIRSLITATTILVVIGYSFPFFNREIDKMVFDELKGSQTLKKIYYQDPVLDGEQLRSQFGLGNRIEIIHIRNTQNFHVPFEY